MAYTLNTFINTEKEPATYDKRLSICLKPNGFSFSITTVCGKLLTFCDAQISTNASISELSANIRSLFADKKLMTFGYKSVELIAPTELSTWIPDHLYEVGHDNQYLSLLGRIKPGTACFSEHNDDLKSYIVFTANSTVVTAFKITFPGIKVRCQHSKFASKSLIQQSLCAPIIIAHFLDQQLDIAAYNNGQLQLSSTYNTLNTSDSLYRTLEVMKTIGLESPSLTLNMCGKVDRQIYQQFVQYFPQVALYTGPSYQFFNPEFQHLRTYEEILTLI